MKHPEPQGVRNSNLALNNEDIGHQFSWLDAVEILLEQRSYGAGDRETRVRVLVLVRYQPVHESRRRTKDCGYGPEAVAQAAFPNGVDEAKRIASQVGLILQRVHQDRDALTRHTLFGRLAFSILTNFPGNSLKPLLKYPGERCSLDMKLLRD